jgi:3-phenylpropionate/cinnamic acid dioxygenase small subunit
MAVEQRERPGLVKAELERACAQFLFYEAELLDANEYQAWQEQCLSKDLVYLVPIRITRERNTTLSEFSSVGFHVHDTYDQIDLRVKRLVTEHAWAEDPPSRTRRLVTNIRVRERVPEEVEVKSNLMIHRSQWDTVEYDLLVAERQDVLRQEEQEWRLLRRLVLLNHTILDTPNLGIFL